jgi:CheY-like chemotaxis protein
VIRLLEPRAKIKGLRITLNVAPDVPVRILADRARLSQVLMNLLGNAVKFTDSGGVSLEVLRLPRPTPQLHFLVRDTGIGIADEIRGKLFEAFSQADTSASRPYEGVGLGLAISRRIVQAMGGTIDFASNERNGTTFFFTLPERTTERRDTPLLMKLPDLAAGSRVLLVDDNQVNRLVAAYQLHSMGLEVVEAESGIGALEALEKTSFAAVLLDCQMPELDGYDTARRVREQERQSGGRHLPIIALTAHAGPEQRDKCLAAGMDDHLAKPFRREELAEILHRWLPSGMLLAAKS